jgi:hypothetical protein
VVPEKSDKLDKTAFILGNGRMSMDRNMILSLSPDENALASREVTLRSGGMKVISVTSPIQARFEIEMGRCGVFLICYRLSLIAADELATLFHRYCPQGQIIFITELPGDKRVPTEANITIPESGGPEQILRALGKDPSPGAVA